MTTPETCARAGPASLSVRYVLLCRKTRGSWRNKFTYHTILRYSLPSRTCNDLQHKHKSCHYNVLKYIRATSVSDKMIVRVIVTFRHETIIYYTTILILWSLVVELWIMVEIHTKTLNIQTRTNIKIYLYVAGRMLYSIFTMSLFIAPYRWQ